MAQPHSQPYIVRVAAGSSTYDVHVGAGVRHRLSSVMPEGARQAAVITQAGIGWQVDSGLEQHVFTVAEGEDAKSLSEVERLCREMSQAGFTRSDVVVALGGGVVSDLAGFVAAVYHRGIRYVTVATTLLAQVDAAIGGKTAVNLPEGKNLVGAFWQPHAVLCDTETLSTLPPRELRSGQGEMAKYHFLTGEDLDALDTIARIAAAVHIKAEVVAADEREGGRRVILNYGHTLAHAIETAGRYDLRHGEAVAVGLIYAAEVALRMGRIDTDRVDAHRRVVASYDLPDRLPAPLDDDDELLALFARDKKALDGVTFVLDSDRGVEPVVGVPDSVQRDALQALR